MEKTEKALKKYIPVLLIAAGFLFMIAGITKFIAVNNYPTATAVITDIEIEEGVDDEADTYKVYVKYAVDGTSYEGMLDSGGGNNKVGDTVTIHYNPKNPEKITSLNNFTVFIILGFGVIVFSAGVVSEITVRRERKAEKMN